MSKLILYLIRHGKTEANEQKLYCGKTDLSLSEAGRDEIRTKKESYHFPSCEVYVSSGAKRANETFEMLYPDVAYEINECFWEYNFGEFEMQSYEMLKEDERYVSWILDETNDVCCPQGESKKEFQMRLSEGFLAFVQDLKNRGIHEALLVSHGGTIGTLLHLFYDSSKDLFRYQPSCGGGYKLSISLEEHVTLDILEEF